MQTILHENMPKEEDGCSARSWRCESPNRDDMEKGRVDGTKPETVKLECKRCPVCMMVLCKHHMSSPRHMTDCNFRSNQERQLLEKERTKEAKIKKQEQDDKSRLSKVKSEFEEKEKKRRKNIADHNAKLKSGR